VRLELNIKEAFLDSTSCRACGYLHPRIVRSPPHLGFVIVFKRPVNSLDFGFAAHEHQKPDADYFIHPSACMHAPSKPEMRDLQPPSSNHGNHTLHSTSRVPGLLVAPRFGSSLQCRLESGPAVKPVDTVRTDGEVRI
jgi:hypothetical protein